MIFYIVPLIYFKCTIDSSFNLEHCGDGQLLFLNLT
jgi:hypothetical protein